MNVDVPIYNDRVLLSRSELQGLGIPVDKTTLLRWELQGRFPRRIRIAGTRVAWLKSEVEAWLAERAAERSSTHYSEY